MRLAVLCCSVSVFSVVALAACDDGGSSNGSATTAAPSTAADARDTTTEVTNSSPDNAAGAVYSLAELGLTFSLADSFEHRAGGDNLFRATNMTPRSVVTIYSEGPDITDHSTRPGERVESIDLGPGITAVMVLDAAIEGLPDRVSANELLVSNGDRSFRVIMSSVSAGLDEVWSVFIASVKVEPSG